MGLFGTLVNGLFGTEQQLEVEGLGTVSCKICNWYHNDKYTWTGYIQFPSYPEVTLFFIDGNAHGVDKRQVQSLHELIADWDHLMDELDEQLLEKIESESKSDTYRNWQKYFVPEAIVPDISSSKSEAWEVTFNGIGKVEDHYFTFNWENGDVKELQLG